MRYRKLQHCINIAIDQVSGKKVNNIDSILDIFGCVQVVSQSISNFEHTW